MNFIRFIAAHEIARALGPDKCIAFCFTGWDNLYQVLLEVEAKDAWDIWNAYDVTPEATKACS